VFWTYQIFTGKEAGEFRLNALFGWAIAIDIAVPQINMTTRMMNPTLFCIWTVLTIFSPSQIPANPKPYVITMAH